jgi:hypothetical protein
VHRDSPSPDIERAHAWLTGYRRLAIRYERHGRLFAAFVDLAAALGAVLDADIRTRRPGATNPVGLASGDGVLPVHPARHRVLANAHRRGATELSGALRPAVESNRTEPHHV